MGSGGLGKDKLVYDSTTPGDGDSVAAFLRVGAIELTATGTALDVNITNAIAVALDGLYDVGTNPTPDTVGSIIRTRGATPGVAAQVEPVTGATLAADALVAANVHGLDVGAFAHIFNGATWDRARGTAGALNVLPAGAVADDGVDAGNPVKVGSRAVSGALVAVSTTGDRADLLSDLYRRIWVNDTPNVAGSNAAVVVDTTVGGVAVFAAPLAGRRTVQIQNLGSKAVFLGFGTVTAANGIRVAAGATETIDIGPDLALKAIAESGSQDVRVLQLA